VLVFEQDRMVLVMLLVPETPTAGIRRDVLMRAAAYIESEGTQAPLVGPTFTAGIHTLDEFLESDPHAGVIRRVITGSVTGLRQQEGKRLSRHPNFRWICSQQEDTAKAVGEFIRATRPGRDRIETLAEDSTGFGASTDTKFTFPWQISRVRNAMPDSQSSAGPGTAAAFNLPFLLRDTRRPTSALPMFAPEQTPADVELVLTQTIDQLEHERNPYVYIVATDVLDSIFLSRLIRAANPNQRILVLEPDLMFLRTEDQHPAIGLLAPATFPVSNHLNLKSLPEKVFDSELSASVFQAASDAIDHPGREGSGRLVDRPLWLMVLGRNGFWPVAQIRPDRQESGAEPEAPKPEPPSFLWRGLFLLLLAGAALWAFLLFRRPRELDIKPGWPGAPDRALSLLLLHTAVQAFVLAGTLPRWFPHSPANVPGSKPFLVLWLTLLLLAVAGWWIWNRMKFSLWALLLTLSPLLLALLANLFAGEDHYLTRRFFAVRSTDLLSGVSPILPWMMITAAFIGVAWAGYQLALLRTERSIDLSLLGALPTSALGRFDKKTALAAGLLGAAFWLAASRLIHSVESIRFDAFFIGGVSLLLASTLYAMARFTLCWRLTRRLLEKLEMHPLRESLKLVAADAGSAPIWETQPRRRSLTYYRRLSELTELGELANRCREYIVSWRMQESPVPRGELEQALAEAMCDLAQRDPILARQFAAIRIPQYLRAVFLTMRNRLAAATAGFVGITLSLNSYAFGPERFIQIFTISLFAVLGLAALMVLLDMNRSEALAELSGSQPGKVDLGLVSKIASASAIPILSIVASYTPAVGKFAGAYLQPALELLAK
jgi:hypothetical protein